MQCHHGNTKFSPEVAETERERQKERREIGRREARERKGGKEKDKPSEFGKVDQLFSFLGFW